MVIGKYGTHPVEIFEAGPTITTIGAGIGFFGRTMAIMKEMGLYDELVKIATGPPQENTGLSSGHSYTNLPIYNTVHI